MAISTGIALFAELINLRNETGRNHFLRIQKAVKCLEDKGWVESVDGGGGDESRAIDRLETECFGDLCCIVSLPTLIQLYYHFPKTEQWEKHKFNIKQMWVEFSSKQKSSTKNKQQAKKNYSPNNTIVSPAEFVQLTPGKQRSEYEKLLNRYDALQNKYFSLNDRNVELETALANINNIQKKISA